MIRLRGNAWETDIFTELIDKTGLVLLQVINHSLHQDLCSRETHVSKANLGASRMSRLRPWGTPFTRSSRRKEKYPVFISAISASPRETFGFCSRLFLRILRP